MSLSFVSAKQQIFSGNGRGPLTLVCQFADSIEISKTNKAFRSANLFATSQVLREKIGLLSLNFKSPQDKQSALQLLNEKIEAYSVRFAEIAENGNLNRAIDQRAPLGELLQYYSGLSDFNSSHNSRLLIQYTGLMIEKLNDNNMGYGAFTCSSTSFISTQRTQRFVVAPPQLVEADWIRRVNESFARRFRSIDMSNPNQIGAVLHATHASQKKLASLTPTAGEAFDNIHREPSPSITHALSFLMKKEEVVLEVQETVGADFFKSIREKFAPLAIRLDRVADETNEGLSHWLYDPNHQRERFVPSDFYHRGVLSPEIWQLTGLYKLHISGCGLTVIPEEIQNLVNLRELDASDNRLEQISEVVARLANLRRLSLNNNRIREVPHFLRDLRFLVFLHLEENPILHPEELNRFQRMLSQRPNVQEELARTRADAEALLRGLHERSAGDSADRENPQRLQAVDLPVFEYFFQLPIWLRIPLFPVWLSWKLFEMLWLNIISPLLIAIQDRMEELDDEVAQADHNVL